AAVQYARGTRGLRHIVALYALREAWAGSHGALDGALADLARQVARASCAWLVAGRGLAGRGTAGRTTGSRARAAGRRPARHLVYRLCANLSGARSPSAACRGKSRRLS